jgi:hypothetical protein
MIVVIQGCDDRELPAIVDFCPNCSSAVTLNGMDWQSDPKLAWFQIREKRDTFFELQITHSDPLQDQFSDYLVFWKIPYQEGVHHFTEELHADFYTSVELDVFEVEYGTPVRTYFPVYDGNSSIEIKSLNRKTGEFIVTFDLHLHPFGHPGEEAQNSSYPNLIHVTGQANGTITTEQ